MRFLVMLCIAMSLPILAQKPKIQKPTISVKVAPPDAVPKGSCVEGEYGYLETSDGHNHWRPYTPAQIGDYMAKSAKRGLVVTLYPQPEGQLWVDATCGVTP